MLSSLSSLLSSPERDEERRSMALIVQDGDIFKSGAEAIVNPVNTQGKTRGGLAKVFMERFPENHRKYVAACKNGTLTIGKVLVTEGGGASRYIINFPTVRESGGAANLIDIELGMDALVNAVIEHQIQSVALPALGAGVGLLGFDDVRDVVKNSIEHIPEVAFILYRPHIESNNSSSRRKSKGSRGLKKSKSLIAVATVAGLTIFSVAVEIASRGFLSRLFNFQP